MEKNDLNQVLKNADPKALRTAMSALSELSGTENGARLQSIAKNLTPDDVALLRRIISDPKSAETLLKQEDVAARIRQLLHG